MAPAYDVPEDFELLFVYPGGRGIRDLAAIDGDLLVLTEPVGDGEGSSERSL